MEPLQAEIICDSICNGKRLVTMVVRMHRFVLAEFNTHRVFSRNSASSRAIPSAKIRDMALNNPALPVEWGVNQKGMQASEVLNSEFRQLAIEEWTRGALADAAAHHKRMEKLGVHKQITNRLLEPFMWHTAVVTATEWDNFFHQRCHPDAQPEMKAVADAMQYAYYTGTPRKLGQGKWHLPFVSDEETGELYDFSQSNRGEPYVELAQKISVARCARVSYLQHDGTRSIKKDLELFDRLVEGNHWSPFEHVATPDCCFTDSYSKQVWDNPGKWGNFVGWIQFRKLFENENRTKFVPNHPALVQLGVTK